MLGSPVDLELLDERDRPLTFHWRVPDAELIRSLVLQSGDRNFIAARNAILTEAMLADAEGHWVSYSRRRSFYAGQQRYRGTAYTFATVLPAVEELARLGLLEEERAHSGQRGRQSRFRATPRLIEALATARVEFELTGLIRLKDEDAHLIDFCDTNATVRMRREMEEINDVVGSIALELAGPDIVETRLHLVVDNAHHRKAKPALYRVFNRGSFRFGGRAYGWYQSLPKARRQQLTMNGEPVAEPDFSQLHASMLYARRGLKMVGDAYETGTYSRDHGKLAFNVALNARSRQGAIAALARKPGWPLSPGETAKLLEDVKRRNAPIAGDLHTDQGIRLMRIDSEITLGAVKSAIKTGIPVLPIHDSMLTPARYEGRVAEIMEDSATRVLGGTSPCRVSSFSPAVPHMPSTGSSFLSPLSGASAQLELFPELASPDFSSQIKALRNRLGLSQRDLAERIGCSQPHVAHVERGRDRFGAWPRRVLRDLLRKVS